MIFNNHNKLQNGLKNSLVISFQIMKTEIKLELSLAPEDIIIQINPAQPTVPRSMYTSCTVQTKKVY